MNKLAALSDKLEKKYAKMADLDSVLNQLHEVHRAATTLVMDAVNKTEEEVSRRSLAIFANKIADEIRTILQDVSAIKHKRD